MTNWRDRRLQDLLGIELPIIQAPMAGMSTPAMAIAVAEAGGLGSLACDMLSPDHMRAELDVIRRRTVKPVNVNFFCHAAAPADAARDAAWRQQLRPYYLEFGLDPAMPVPATALAPFGEPHCDVLEDIKPAVVSFHFGLPNDDLLRRVKATGAKVLSSATSVKEAVWLERKGCDAIIAQG